jgi:hypothetical protein
MVAILKFLLLDDLVYGTTFSNPTSLINFKKAFHLFVHAFFIKKYTFLLYQKTIYIHIIFFLAFHIINFEFIMFGLCIGKTRKMMRKKSINILFSFSFFIFRFSSFFSAKIYMKSGIQFAQH